MNRKLLVTGGCGFIGSNFTIRSSAKITANFIFNL